MRGFAAVTHRESCVQQGLPSQAATERTPQTLQEAGERNLCCICLRCRDKIFLLVNSNTGTARLQFVQHSKVKYDWKIGGKLTEG